MNNLFKPKFDNDIMAKEMIAVDNEFKLTRNNDGERLRYLQRKIMTNPKSYFNRLEGGNKQSLECENYREKVMQFYKAHYSLSIAKICLLSEKSLTE